MSEDQDLDKLSLWSYFKKVGENEDRLAACFFCEKVYCYKTTIFNLKQHLLKKHYDEMDINPEVLLNVKQQRQSSDVKYPIKKELFFQYFDVISKQDKIAECNICKRKLSFRTNYCNLKKHLQIMHNDEFERLTIRSMSEALKSGDEDGSKSSDDENDAVEGDDDLDTTNDVQILKFYQSSNALSSSEVWRLFEKETGGRARCGLCLESVTSSEPALMNHLRRRHAKITLKDIPDSNDEGEKETNNLESATDDDHYTEVVYLEEFGDGTVQNVTKKFNSKYAKKKKRRFSAADEDNQTVKRKKTICPTNRQEEDKEIFLKYLSNLLKDIPKERFMKLQLDMINLVMAARIKHEFNTSSSCTKTNEISQCDVASSSVANHNNEDSSEIRLIVDNVENGDVHIDMAAKGEQLTHNGNNSDHTTG